MSQNHGPCGDEQDHDHDHDHDNPDVGPRDNLFAYIDRSNVVALNAGDGRGPEVIKPWHLRNDSNVFLVSEEDNEMIIRVPFSGSVNLRSLLLKTGTPEHSNTTVSLYANENDLDFQDVGSKQATQTFHVAQGSLSVGEYSVMRAKFSNISSIALYFDAQGAGADPTQIFYVGFLGHWSEHKRTTITAIYEAQANLADHEKIQGLDGTLSSPQS